MHKSIRMLVVAGLLVVGLASWGVSQMMMGGSQGYMSQTPADTTSQQEQSSLMQMMQNMSNHNAMISQNFTKLEQDFNQMMQINDMTALKSAMKNHQQMMQSMHSGMMTQQNMFANMMAMMQSGGRSGMNGTMGMMGGNNSGNSAQHTHDH